MFGPTATPSSMRVGSSKTRYSTALSGSERSGSGVVGACPPSVILGREVGQPFGPAFRPSILDDGVLSFNPPELPPQPLPEYVEPGRVIGTAARPKITYPGNLPRLLRPGGKRRGKCPECESAEERAPVHSMT